VLPVKVKSPEYWAVTECGIGAAENPNCGTIRLATPLPLRLAEPRLVPPSKKFTLPVGTVLPEAGVTAAVKVTVCPSSEGFAEELSVVVVEVRT
jgi:hypothetical protein